MRKFRSAAPVRWGLNNATPTVGFVEPGLNQTTTGLRNTVNGATSSGTAFAQCSNASLSNSSGAAGVIQFQENFATAFKTRYDIPPLLLSARLRTGRARFTTQNPV
jgi:hypothetical protein